MPRFKSRRALLVPLSLLLLAATGCLTKPDAEPTDNDMDKWYVRCRLHDVPWCEGPFRREKDATKAGWEHEFWLHMGQNTTRVGHEPCESANIQPMNQQGP